MTTLKRQVHATFKVYNVNYWCVYCVDSEHPDVLSVVQSAEQTVKEESGFGKIQPVEKVRCVGNEAIIFYNCTHTLTGLYKLYHCYSDGGGPRFYTIFKIVIREGCVCVLQTSTVIVWLTDSDYPFPLNFIFLNRRRVGWGKLQSPNMNDWLRLFIQNF